MIQQTTLISIKSIFFRAVHCGARTGTERLGHATRLTHYIDCALRLLIHLADIGDRDASIAEVAKAIDISRTHLMKIASAISAFSEVLFQYPWALCGKGDVALG